jgi:dTMP kinase
VKSKAGLYIAIEGGEGAGKSTQAKRLAQAFRDLLVDTVHTREPGGTAIGSEIRRLVLEGVGEEKLGRRAEALLFAADRAHHVESIVYPALYDGRVVIQDRSVGSSLAYQACAGGLDWNSVLNLSVWGMNGIMPHLTIYLDLDPAEGLRRAFMRGNTNRFEGHVMSFHEKVRKGFQMQAQAHNWKTVDASASADKVHEQVLAIALEEACLFGHEPHEQDKQ